MNLLQLLMGTMTSDDSVESLSKKTGVSNKNITALLALALPLLISYLTKNASKGNGATSLLEALGQHTSTDTVSTQIKNSDSADGAKIINHIFGSDLNNVVNNLAKETGISSADVNSVLDSIAPALLNSISTATSATSTKPQANKVDLSDGIDLSDLAGLLNGSSVSNTNANPVAGLLGSLLGSNSSQNTSNIAENLIGSLLGSSGNAKQSNGTELLNLLTSLNK